MTNSQEDELVKVIRWKLDIPVEPASRRTQEVWSQIVNEVDYNKVASIVAESLTGLLKQAIECKFGLDISQSVSDEDSASLHALWQCFTDWIKVSGIYMISNSSIKIQEIFNNNLFRDSTLSIDHLAQLILWKLELAPLFMYERTNPKINCRKWKRLENKLDFPGIASEIAKFLAEHLLEEVIRYRLDLLKDHVANKEDIELFDSKWGCFKKWLHDEDGNRSLLISREIRNGLAKASSDQVQHLLRNVSDVNKSAGSSIANNQVVNLQSTETGTTPSIVAKWKYLPIPDDPDKHTEFDSRRMDIPDGFKLIGARTRGKKHKHEGTNCDDWFHFTVSGDWTIISVSDGAGSKKFSRVGSEVACKAAVTQLSASLKDHKVKYRDTWSAETFRRDDTGVSFAEEDLEFIQKALHISMLSAYEAMEKATAERFNSADHFEVLGRRLEISDLSATLLLAVHTTVQLQNGETSLIFTCSIGDGMVAVVDKNGATRLLMTPDSGQYSGEVTFLSKKEVQPEKLVGRTFPFLGTVRALLVMTDGVADDYFPNDPGMSLLYGDLILNQIINLQGTDEQTVAKALSKTKLPTLADVSNAEFYKLVERITDKYPTKVMIHSMVTYAEKLDIPVQDVLASPALLMAGSIGETMFNEILPEEKLRVWLDSYQVRGSFDDRTLVIMYREVF